MPALTSRILRAAAFAFVLAPAGTVALAQPADPAATVRGYHAAVASGNAQAAAALLAPDAVILESGERMNRKDFVEHHLPEDIEFERAIPIKYGDVIVTASGDTAWAVRDSVIKGTWKDKEVNSLGVELFVLTRGASGWTIRAIHASSRRAK